MFPNTQRQAVQADPSIIPMFFVEPVLNGYRSEQEGRPIHEDREFIRILIAGDNKSEVVREATDYDRERFAVQYQQFKAGLREEEQQVGTLLSSWAAMSRAIVKDFNSVNVFTVEQLAAMGDTAIGNFGMGGLEWRAKARAMIEQAKDSGAASRYAAENERLKADVERLSAQVRELAARIPDDDGEFEEGDAAPRKRGWPAGKPRTPRIEAA